jgi:hypothetical protein
MFNPFSYISSRIKSAVIRGFGEGLEAIGAFEPEEAPGSTSIEALKARLAALALPDKQADPETAEGGKKARKTA